MSRHLRHLKLVDKACNFISLYRSLRQTKNEFESFVGNLEFNLDSVARIKPHLIFLVFPLDSNAQRKAWYLVGKTAGEDTRINGFTSHF